MSREEAQELHSFGAEPAANLKPDNNQAAEPCALELWICLVPLASGGGRDGGPWLDVCARVGLAAAREGAHDGGIQGELRAMPQRQAIGDNLYAPLVRDRHIEVHVRKPDVSGDPGAGFTTDPRHGMLQGQRTRGQDPRGGAGRAGQAPHGSGICAARAGGEVAGGAAAEPGTARWGWRPRRE